MLLKRTGEETATTDAARGPGGHISITEPIIGTISIAPSRYGRPELRDRAEQALLVEAGQRLAGCLNVRRCLRAAAELAVAHLADAAVVVGPPDGARAPAARARAGVPAEESLVRRAELTAVPALNDSLSQFPPRPIHRLGPDTIPAGLLPAGTGPVGELLLIPMSGHGAPAGALLLARSPDRPGVTPADSALAETLASTAGAAIAAAVLFHEQVDALGMLQADLFPPPLPLVDGVDLAGSYQPAGHSLLAGGDFYDILPPGDAGHPLVVLGDVCGKGARAAALTGRVRQSLRALQLVQPDPDELLRLLNQAILPTAGSRQEDSGQFVTVVVGSVVAADTGEVNLTLATGGHLPPLVLRANGSVQEVPLVGMLIGVLPEPPIGTASLTLSPGELCLLYSDGVTEARGGSRGRQAYGERRLREALGSCYGMPTAPTLERLRQLVSDWLHGGPHDDIAMLAVQAPPPGRP